MSGGYNPIVNNPFSNRQQVKSKAFQVPFFFGASAVPHDLGLPKSMYNGSKGEGIHKGSPSMTRKGDYDYTTKQGSKVFHRRGHNIKMPNVLPFMK